MLEGPWILDGFWKDVESTLDDGFWMVFESILVKDIGRILV